MGPGGQNDPRGKLVRPYAVTRGRTEPRQDITLDSVLLTTPTGRQEGRFAGHDKQRIAMLCDNHALSLAEIAAYERLPLGVTRVLVADMVSDGLLALHGNDLPESYQERMQLLERVLSGLRRL